jgi:hypothetical protein
MQVEKSFARALSCADSHAGNAADVPTTVDTRAKDAGRMFTMWMT